MLQQRILIAVLAVIAADLTVLAVAAVTSPAQAQGIEGQLVRLNNQILDCPNLEPCAVRVVVVRPK